MAWDDVDRAWNVEVKSTAMLVLVALAYHANRASGRAFPGADLLAHETGLHVRTVRRELASLVEVGAVEVIEKGHTGKATAYRLTLDRAPHKPAFIRGRVSRSDRESRNGTRPSGGDQSLIRGGQPPLHGRESLIRGGVPPQPQENHNLEPQPTSTLLADGVRIPSGSLHPLGIVRVLVEEYEVNQGYVLQTARKLWRDHLDMSVDEEYLDRLIDTKGSLDQLDQLPECLKDSVVDEILYWHINSDEEHYAPSDEIENLVRGEDFTEEAVVDHANALLRRMLDDGWTWAADSVESLDDIRDLFPYWGLVALLLQLDATLDARRQE